MSVSSGYSSDDESVNEQFFNYFQRIYFPNYNRLSIVQLSDIVTAMAKLDRLLYYYESSSLYLDLKPTYHDTIINDSNAVRNYMRNNNATIAAAVYEYR